MNRELPVINFGSGQDYPLFDRISIETINQCTRSCSFCPLQFRENKVQSMTDELYQKVIDELETLKFSGVIQWFYLNEPLMDKKRHYRLNLLRKACPDATIHITSNGDTLKDFDAFETEVLNLFKYGVNSLNFNVYDDSKEKYFKWVKIFGFRNDHIGVGDEHCWKAIKHRYLSVSDMRNPEHLHNWTGTFDYGDTENKTCSRPARHLVVQYDGQIPLCCAQDPTRKEFQSFGNVNYHSLKTIWNSERFFQYRFNLQNKIRKGQCAGCNEIVKGSDDVRRVSV